MEALNVDLGCRLVKETSCVRRGNQRYRSAELLLQSKPLFSDHQQKNSCVDTSEATL